MDWATAVSMGIEENKEVKMAIIRTEISNLTYRIQVEEGKEDKGIAKVLKAVLKIQKDHLAQVKRGKK